MNNLTAGSFPLFRVAGIQVYVHWAWLLVAYFEIVNRINRYESMACYCTNSAMRWLAGKWVARPIGSFCGPWAGQLSCNRRRGRVLTCGVLPRAHWSM